MLRVKQVFLQTHFEYFTSSLLTSLLHSVLRSHSASNSRVSEVSNFVLTSFMMSEVRWTAVENVLFFSKPSIVTKLPVMNMNLKFCRTSGSPDNQAFRVRNMCYCLSNLYSSRLWSILCTVLLALFNSKGGS